MSQLPKEHQSNVTSVLVGLTGSLGLEQDKASGEEMQKDFPRKMSQVKEIVVAEGRDVEELEGCLDARERWYKYFNAFRRSMDISTETPPADKDIENFLLNVRRQVKRHLTAHSTYIKASLRYGLYSLTSGIACNFPEFSLTYNQSARLKSCIEEMTPPGVLEAGRWKKSPWVAFVMMRILIQSYLKDGLMDGARSWDVRVCRWLNIVLLFATNYRPEEVTPTKGLEKGAYLKWEDITISMRGGTTIKHFVAAIKLRQEKESKDDSTSYHTIYCTPLEFPDSNVLDPINVLLIHAFRSGQLQGDMTSVLADCAKCETRVLRWAIPNLPVIPALLKLPGLTKNKKTRRGQRRVIGLDYKIPARTTSTEVALNEIVAKAGVIGELLTRNELREDVMDFSRHAHLYSSTTEGSQDAPRLPHLDQLRRSISPPSQDTTLCVLNAVEKDAKHNESEFTLLKIMFLPEPLKPAPISNQEVNQYLVEHPTISHDQARRDLMTAQQRKWMNASRTKLESQQPLLSAIALKIAACANYGPTGFSAPHRGAAADTHLRVDLRTSGGSGDNFAGGSENEAIPDEIVSRRSVAIMALLDQMHNPSIFKASENDNPFNHEVAEAEENQSTWLLDLVGYSFQHSNISNNISLESKTNAGADANDKTHNRFAQ